VERFIDRLRSGKLRPYTPDLLGDPVEYENTVREQVSEAFILRNHRAPTPAELGQLTRSAMEHPPVRGVQRFSRALLSGIPVIAADDVARYCAALPASLAARQARAEPSRHARCGDACSGPIRSRISAA
jgi:hypothetical protein